MSKIDELINELCPDGVEYRELKSVCNDFIVPMRDKPKSFSGLIPWCRIEDIQGQYIHTSLSGSFVSEETVRSMNLKVFPIGTVICSCSASLGAYAINTQPLITNQTFIGIVCGKSLLNKYLFYIMHTMTDRLILVSNAGTIPYISRKKFEDLTIPIPPLPIQEEIVRILDKFTALEAELEAELDARKKQYEYYRNKLLTPIEIDGKWYMNGIEVEWKTLGDISKLEYGKGLKSSDRREGDFPVVGSNGIVGYHDEYYVDAPCIIVGRKGSAGAITWITDSCYPIDTTYFVQLKTGSVRLRYLYQFLLMIGLSPETKSAGVPGLNRNEAYQKKIPIPPLEEQERIVSILDRFDALVNDISIGLPAEIAARRRQYEYYRNKLLSFRNIAEAKEA